MASSAQGLTGRTARRVYLALFERDPKKDGLGQAVRDYE